MQKFRIAIICIAVICIALLCCRCASEGLVDIYLTLSPLAEEDPLDPNLISHIRVRVTGPDMSPIETISVFTPGGASKVAAIPVGENRVVTVEALKGESGYPISRGRSLPMTIDADHVKLSLLIARIGVFSYAPGYGLHQARFGYTAAITNGGLLMIAGGAAAGTIALPTKILASVEVFDPVSGTTAYLACGDAAHGDCLETPRAFAAGVPMDNGVWLVGGMGVDESLSSTALIDVAHDKVVESQLLAVARSHAATAVTEKTTVVAGGFDGDGNVLDTIELFHRDGRVETMQLPGPRWGMAVAGTDAKAVFFGGMDAAGAVISDLVIIDPATKSMDIYTPDVAPRVFAQAVTFSDDRVLIIGGLTADNTASADIDLLDLSTLAMCRVGTLDYPLWHSAGVRLADGRVLVIGGLTGDAPGEPTSHSAILDGRYIKMDPACEQTTEMLALPVSPARIRRYLSSAILMDNGIVVLVGGLDQEDQPILETEIFVPDE